ncbi:MULTISPECIES: hypothetical protein [unclassified Streptomyces]|uniref:hypothetical protein n=1 Tax=unclassified Streptomyces TaxID=2593676 RepID=UPI000DB90A4D|nr:MULTISPECIES: hypothetical protein [unclassified Streptomyces]MYT68732.1 hypothetical protein [Streptomyces sp. SID8367]RAJ86405.1 hypothetical protein K377_03253 [Streptomyces sp. PsTaAH-137]
MARHAQSTSSTRTRRSLLNAGLVVGAAGAALVAGGGAAGAAVPTGDGSDLTSATQAATGALHGSTATGLGTLKTLQLDPLANTGVDPLDNAVGTQLADFAPLSTAAVTAPLTSGGSLDDLPLVGPATHLLPN